MKLQDRVHIYLNPTAVTEEVGLSDPVKVSLMTSGGCLAMLNMVARTAQHQMRLVGTLPTPYNTFMQTLCTHTHTHTRTHARTRTHTHTHTQIYASHTYYCNIDHFLLRAIHYTT